MTSAIYEGTKTISEYKICPGLEVDFSKLGTQSFTVDGRQFVVDVLDSVTDYVEYMKEIFDFEAIRGLLASGDTQSGFQILLDAMHGGK